MSDFSKFLESALTPETFAEATRRWREASFEADAYLGFVREVVVEKYDEHVEHTPLDAAIAALEDARASIEDEYAESGDGPGVIADCVVTDAIAIIEALPSFETSSGAQAS